MTSVKKSRREFLTSGGSLLGTSWLAINMPMVMAAGQSAQDNIKAETGYINISAEQAAELSAIVDQIVPADETPGATDTGVVYFIDAALGGFMADERLGLQAGLEDFRRKAMAVDAGIERFSDLSLQQQTELLKTEEESQTFQMLHFLTMCGMFCLPQYGGNRDKAGWELLGFDHQHAWQPPFGYYDAAVHAPRDDIVDDHE